MSWFHSNMFNFQSIILNLFLWIFRDFVGFIWLLKTPKFQVLIFCLPGPGGRPTGRPDQEPVDRTGRPNVHKNVHKAVSVGRSTDWRQPTLGLPRSTGRSTGQRAVALWFRARSTGRSIRRLNSQKFDRWPVDWKANSGLVSCQRADSFWGL